METGVDTSMAQDAYKTRTPVLILGFRGFKSSSNFGDSCFLFVCCCFFFFGGGILEFPIWPCLMDLWFLIYGYWYFMFIVQTHYIQFDVSRMGVTNIMCETSFSCLIHIVNSCQNIAGTLHACCPRMLVLLVVTIHLGINKLMCMQYTKTTFAVVS